MRNWHSLEKKEVFNLLKADEKGLNTSEAEKRLSIYGKNQLIKQNKLNPLKIALRQFTSVLVMILLVAAIISAFMKHWVDFYVIIGIVILNSLFGFIQEFKAEKAIERLRSLLVPIARVVRNKRIEEIDSREIVPGDILVLSEGDKIMADARILEEADLQINESSLTGESNYVEKRAEVINAETPLVERKNMIYQGTEIIKGNCRAIVISTGMNTEYGRIASLVQKVEAETNPLKEKIDKFARNLGLFTLILLVLFFAIGVLSGFNKLDMFMTAVSLAVSIIPEGLPAVITISLALANQRMLKHNTLIRKLSSSETLGRVTVICTDKTGTITEEKMKVESIYVNGKIEDKFQKSKEAEMLFKIGVLCNNARLENEGNEEYIIGDPTEKAILLAGRDYGINKIKETKEQARVKEFSFSSARKIMSIVRMNKEYTSYVKGAPEIVINRSNYELINNRIKRINEKRRKELIISYEELAGRGMRVLAMAYKPVIGKITQERAEENLIFVGMQAMIDPPRAEVKESIKICKEAGIQVIMITGDSYNTSAEIAKQIGLEGKVVSSKELEKMSLEDLRREIGQIGVFSRVSPEHKLKIIEALKANQEVVAMTGDGVNDAPALKRADIGIAVNRGTDVAKDSSSMILLDNNFASIPKAVREGRKVYDNIRKFIRFLLASNFSEVFLVIAVLLIWRDPNLLPLLPLQILWINLISDSFPALALSQEHGEKEIMSRKPNKKSLLADMKLFIFLSGLITFLFGFYVFFRYMDDLTKARTMAVTMSIIFQMFLAFNSKSHKSVFKSRRNNWLIAGVGLSILLHLIVMYTPICSLFSFTPLLIKDWGLIIGLGVIGFLLIEGFKLIRKEGFIHYGITRP